MTTPEQKERERDGGRGATMSYDIQIKRCSNLDDHKEHTWQNQREQEFFCPGMPCNEYWLEYFRKQDSEASR